MLSAIRENVRLAPYTTLRIGGIARYFVDVTNEDQLREAVDFAKAKALDIFVLGGGSNVLIADAGFKGVVLHIDLEGISFDPQKDEVIAIVAAGENWDNFVNQCVAKNLSGVECLSGIPGKVGGTPIQNVGAYGQDVSESISKVRAFDRQTKTIVELTNQQCGFGYRSSIFNTTERDRYVVIAVDYLLKKNGEPALRYPDLQKYFESSEASPTLAEVRAAVLSIRASKAMVITPNDPDSQSVGSFFKNPVVIAEKFAEIKKAAKKLQIKEVPHFPAADNKIKIPAAWLIEQAGFVKGYSRGRVGISSKHTLALINKSNATADEMLTLMRRIQEEVNKRFGVALLPEPIYISSEGW